MMSAKQPEIVEMDFTKLEALLDRAEQGAIEKEDYQTIRAVFESYYYLTQLIDRKSTTISRLRKLLFGASTEKTAAVLAGMEAGVGADGADGQQPDADKDQGSDRTASQTKKTRAKGHGRNGAEDYPGADRVAVPHESLQPGDACPDCSRVPSNLRYPIRVQIATLQNLRLPLLLNGKRLINRKAHHAQDRHSHCEQA